MVRCVTGLATRRQLSDSLRRWVGMSEPIRALGRSSGRRSPLHERDRRSKPTSGRPERRPTHRHAAPPAMILDVLRPAAGQDQIDDRGERGFPSLTGVSTLVTVPGERARLNASTEVEWLRPLRIGDWVTVRCKILDVALKAGRTGPAVFITEERRYADQTGEPLAVVRQTTVRTVARGRT
jgi:hydroxyacyl-ACP dehydratase HTD2-like protein with hotdog domain